MGLNTILTDGVIATVLNRVAVTTQAAGQHTIRAGYESVPGKGNDTYHELVKLISSLGCGACGACDRVAFKEVDCGLDGCLARAKNILVRLDCVCMTTHKDLLRIRRGTALSGEDTPLARLALTDTSPWNAILEEVWLLPPERQRRLKEVEKSCDGERLLEAVKKENAETSGFPGEKWKHKRNAKWHVSWSKTSSGRARGMWWKLTGRSSYGGRLQPHSLYQHSFRRPAAKELARQGADYKRRLNSALASSSANKAEGVFIALWGRTTENLGKG